MTIATTRNILAAMIVTALAAHVHAAPPVVWEVSDGIERPESAYLHAETGSLFLSNIAGAGDAKDGTGWITKATPDGKVVKLKWADGLSAPKGMRAAGGVLYVSDIDRLVGFRIADGEKVVDVTVPDAKFLNDVAAGHDGTVYVSDMRSNRIWQYKDGDLAVFAEGDHLESPNGLLVSGTRLLVGGWSAEEGKAGHLYALDLRTKEKSLITPDITGNVDGIELDGRGNYIVTDWMAGKVLKVSPEGKASTILELERGTADHAYLADKGLLILPRMMENKVTAYQLEKPPAFKDLTAGDNPLANFKTTGNWTVKEGNVLDLTPRPGEKGWQRYGAYLWLPEKYGDFELSVDYKIPDGGNSGVYVRVADMNSPVDHGIEVQVLDSYKQTKELGHHDNGGIIRTTGPTKNMSIPAGQWNTMLVRARGSQLTVVLNGEQVQDLDLSKTPMKDRPLTGYIGIQDHGLPMQVRNVKIRELE